jgi:nucleoside-diphosphate-sugar epimerase
MSATTRQGRVLLTGGAGFIGVHLTRRLLDDGFAVDLVDNMSRGVEDEVVASLREDPGVSFHVADLRDPHALDGLGDDFTHVVHFAALLGVQNVIDRPSAVLRDNVTMVETMLDFSARQQHLERFVFPSTSEVYAGTQQHFTLPIPSAETTPLAVSPLDRPRTSYMLSKIYGEALVHHAGVPFTIVRPHNFYGPRMGLSHVVPQLLQRIFDAQDGDQLTVYSIDHSRTMCHIDDAVEYIARLMVADAATGGTFNVGVQAPEVTIGELAQVLCEVVGRDLEIVAGETTPGSPPRRCPDMNLTIEVTGHEPGVSLRDGVQRTFDWYRTHVFEGAELSAI